MTRACLSCLVCGVLLQSPKDTIADPLPKHLIFGQSAVWLVVFSCAMLPSP